MREKKPIEIKCIRLINKLVNLAVLVAILLPAALSCYALWDSNDVVKNAESEQYEKYKPQEDALSFDELCELNPDVVGWLTIYGTYIDYPLVQGEDNEVYISRNPLGEYSLTGSLFLDYRNSRDFSDFNTIIYGHNMSPPIMFGTIRDFKEEDYFESHKYGEVYFGGRSWGLEIFAIVGADSYDTKIYAPGVQGEENKTAYLENLLANAVYKRDVGVTAADKILVLSTCSNVGTNARDLLIARVTDQLYENEFYTEDEQNIFTIDKVERWWMWILLGIMLILVLLIAVYHRKRRRKT
jgi:sortase B